MFWIFNFTIQNFCKLLFEKAGLIHSRLVRFRRRTDRDANDEKLQVQKSLEIFETLEIIQVAVKL